MKKQISLTNLQQSIANDIKKSKAKSFLLSGARGTGKTTIINEVIKTFPERNTIRNNGSLDFETFLALRHNNYQIIIESEPTSTNHWLYKYFFLAGFDDGLIINVENKFILNDIL
jgi:predicted AAA+ superfamily ATPase